LATTLKATGIEASITADQLVAIANRAMTMGQSGDQAIIAFAGSIEKANTRALAANGIFINSGRVMDDFAQSIGLTTTQLTKQQQQQAILAEVLRQVSSDVAVGTSRYAEQDAALADLTRSWELLKFRVSEYLSGPGLAMLESINAVVASMAKWGRVVAAVGRALTKTLLLPILAVVGAITDVGKAGKALAAGDFAGAAAAAAKAALVVDEIVDAGKAWRDVVTEVQKGGSELSKTVDGIRQVGSAFSQTAAVANIAYAAVGSVAQRLGDDAAAAAKRAAAATKAAAAAAKARAKRAAAAAVDAKFFADLDRDSAAVAAADGERRRSEIQALEARATSLRSIRDLELDVAATRAAGDPAAALRVQTAKIELDVQRQIAAAKIDMNLSDIEQARHVAAIQEQGSQRQIAAIKAAARATNAATSAQVRGFMAAGQAANELLGQIEGTERAIAAVKAIMSAGEAYLAYARGDYVGMASAIIAAGIFGAQAAGATSAPSPGESGRSSGPGASRIPQGAAAAPAGGPTQITIKIEGGLVTQAEVGAAVHAALGAAKRAGVAT